MSGDQSAGRGDQKSSPQRRGPGVGPAGGRCDRAGRPPRGRRPEVDLAREAAYMALAAVREDDAYANLALPGILRELGLAGRDAALATELAYGTLRMTGTLDAVIASGAGRPTDRIDPPVLDALRLGCYQLLCMRVPSHAATTTTVDMVRLLVPGAVGFANAVLRRIGERDLATWLELLAPAYDADPVGNLAMVHAHPEWIVRAVADALGGSDQPAALAETGVALAADNAAAQVVLCARPGRIDQETLAAEVGGVPGRYGRYAVVLPGGAPGGLRALGTGVAHVQDEGSQLVATALADADLAGGADERWLDLCAGPGGKAALLGSIAALRGARLTAIEIIEHRAALVAQAVRGLPVDVHIADGREVGVYDALPAGGFDRVLVDAPCTGLGSLRRRPEARWRRQPSDLPALTRLQRELLGAALRAVRPGGVVGYVTCSPHLVETRVSVASAVGRAGREKTAITAVPVDVRPLLPDGMAELGPGPHVQLWPHRHGTDGMFLALLRRD